MNIVDIQPVPSGMWLEVFWRGLRQRDRECFSAAGKSFSNSLVEGATVPLIWGVLSAVYGGAIHPTAEGHAAMADAALAGAKAALQLSGASEPIIASPLPPLPAAGK